MIPTSPIAPIGKSNPAITARLPSNIVAAADAWRTAGMGGYGGLFIHEKGFRTIGREWRSIRDPHTRRNASSPRFE
jgi:hypothetical protein